MGIENEKEKTGSEANVEDKGNYLKQYVGEEKLFLRFDKVSY